MIVDKNKNNKNKNINETGIDLMDVEAVENDTDTSAINTFIVDKKLVVADWRILHGH